MSRVLRLLDLHLTICAAGHGVKAPGRLPVVCGLPPGHGGPVHRDVQLTLQWPNRHPEAASDRYRA